MSKKRKDDESMFRKKVTPKNLKRITSLVIISALLLGLFTFTVSNVMAATQVTITGACYIR